MAIITNVLVLEKGLRADFVKSFNTSENPQDVMPYIMETQSSSDKEKYGWLGQVPQLTEWIDERKLKGLNDFDYTIPNKSFEATLQIDRDYLEDDQLGAIKIRISDLAKRAKTHPRKLFFELLEAGTTGLCYDGQPFFSASHSEGVSGTQSNLQTGTGITLAQLKADFEVAIATMENYKDDQGEPYNEGEKKYGVICKPELRAKFSELNTLKLINSSENGMKGMISQLTVSARLTDVNDWYLAVIDGGALKPIVKQNRRPIEFNILDKSETAFMRKKIPAGVDYRVGFGYGMWQKMIKVANT